MGDLYIVETISGQGDSHPDYLYISGQRDSHPDSSVECDCVTDSRPQCLAKHPVKELWCAKEKGHTGNHKACQVDRHNVSQWINANDPLHESMVISCPNCGDPFNPLAEGGQLDPNPESWPVCETCFHKLGAQLGTNAETVEEASERFLDIMKADREEGRSEGA